MRSRSRSSVVMQNGTNLFPAPLLDNIPVVKSMHELAKEKAAAVSPFKATLTTAGMYTGGLTAVGGLSLMGVDYTPSSTAEMLAVAAAFISSVNITGVTTLWIKQ
ncbi:hypothetical protein J4Q44_G00132850 [Coregonus suidteri]|uniref:Uncharacterized protein n=1 Tax=Coregonus suidteri TaxID=861788 RepID=A0AAN8M2K8_9TELE